MYQQYQESKTRDFSTRELAYQRWSNFLKKKYVIYGLGILAVALTNIMQVLMARNIGWILDFFTDAQLPSFLAGITWVDTFTLLFSILLFSALLTAFGRIAWRLTLARQTHEAAAMLKKSLWSHVRFFSKSDLQSKYSKGHLMNISTSDVQSGRFIYGFTLIAICDVVFLGLLTIATMLLIDWQLTLYIILVLTFIPIAVQRLALLEIERHEKAQEDLDQLNDLAARVVSTIRLQRLSQTGRFWTKKLMNQAEEYRKRRLSSAYTELHYIPLMGGGSLLAIVILFAIGSFFVFQGRISIGDFVALQGLSFLLQGPLLELGFVISEWRKSMTSLSRVEGVVQNPKEPSLISAAQVDENSITDIDKVCDLTYDIRQLCFSYRVPLFENLDLKVEKGDRLGIMGSIGSGKSTLLNILAGLERENVKGEIFLWGNRLYDYSHQFLRKNILMVHQRPFLFSTTIAENLTVGADDQNIDQEQLWHYLEIAGLAQDVHSFPGKLKTPLGEWGLNLSGGQKQRLTLARALMKRPKILLLDDCLSAVDTITEEKILQGLDRHLQSTTLVWVAHRQSTLKYCHKVINLDEYSALENSSRILEV